MQILSPRHPNLFPTPGLLISNPDTRHLRMYTHHVFFSSFFRHLHGLTKLNPAPSDAPQYVTANQVLVPDLMILVLTTRNT